MIGLPADFACFGEASKGGGVIQVLFLPLLSLSPSLFILSLHLILNQFSHSLHFLSTSLTFNRVPRRIVSWFVSLLLGIQPWRLFAKNIHSLRMEFYCPNWWHTAPKRLEREALSHLCKCWFVLHSFRHLLLSSLLSSWFKLFRSSSFLFPLLSPSLSSHSPIFFISFHCTSYTLLRNRERRRRERLALFITSSLSPRYLMNVMCWPNIIIVYVTETSSLFFS